MGLPFLDFTARGFSTRSDDVYAARAQSWCARTPYGLCVLRHREAGFLLRDKRLRQGSYAWTKRNQIKGSFARFWENSVIGQEGDVHKAMRAVIVPALSEAFVTSLTPKFRENALALAESLQTKTSCDFVAEFTRPFAGKAICSLFDLDVTQWERIAFDASHLGLAMTVDCRDHQQVFDAACDRLMVLADELVERVRCGADESSFAARLVAEFDKQNALSHQALLDLIVIAIFGGVDTTKAQLGFLMGLLIDNPAQWQALKAVPGKAMQAVDEAIRHRPTTTWATREAVVDFEFQGVEIKKGTTVHVLSHATSTDPLVTENDDFDLNIRRKKHFGFGAGAHHCVGHFMARTDMAVALQVLLEHFDDFALDGDPAYAPDSGNTTPITMPLTYRVLTSCT